MTTTVGDYHRFNPQSGGDPMPPYSVDLIQYLLVGLSFPRSAVRALVPESLELSDPVGALMCTGHAPVGWGVTPFSNFYLGFVVDNAPSPDGTAGLYRVANVYSEPSASLFRRRGYSDLLWPGQHRFAQVGRRWTAKVDCAPIGLAARLEVSAAPDSAEVEISGIHHYISRRATGALTSYHVGFAGVARTAQVDRLDFGRAGMLAGLGPAKVLWANQVARLAISIGPPRETPFDAQPADRLSGLTALLSQIGISAVILDRAGGVVGHSGAGQSLLAEVAAGAGPAGGQGHRTLRALDPAVVQALRPEGHLGAPVPLARAGGLPLIAEALRLPPEMAGDGAMLVLLRDTQSGARPDAAQVLSLMGLTAAEARVAALVGSGLAPGDAAKRLGLTSNTVRSALKIAFDKLGIGRQAELAALLSRLG